MATKVKALVDLRESKVVQVTKSVLKSSGKGFAEVCEELNGNGNLINLTVSKIVLDASDVNALCNLIKVNTSITSLELLGNSIGDGGVSALSEAFKVNTSITSLKLWFNNIGAPGARALSEALKVNTAVTLLELTGNSIGDAGAVALSESLKVNTSITTLFLAGNNIGKAGAEALSEALQVNTAITELTLHGNKISYAVKSALEEAVRKNERARSEKVKSEKARQAYEDQMERKVNVFRGRIILVGQDRAGKTSLRKSLLGQKFDPKEISTVGVAEVVSAVVPKDKEQSTWKKAEKDDTLNSRVNRELARNVVEQMKKDEPLEKETDPEKTGLKKDTPSDVPGQDGVADASSGTKRPGRSEKDESADATSGTERPGRSEVKKNEVSENEEHKQLLQEIELLGYNGISEHVIELLEMETDKNPIKATEFVVDIWDLAGQQLYCTANSAYLTDDAIYLLVHDLTKELDAEAVRTVKHDPNGDEIPLPNPNKITNYQILLSWLETIDDISKVTSEKDGGAEVTQTGQTRKDKPLSPPVFIVGTHADKTTEEQMEKVKHTITNRFEGKPCEAHLVGEMFPVDNTRTGVSRNDLNSLLSAIANLLKQESIPAKWFRFKEAIRIYGKGKKFVTVKEAEQIARDVCKIEDVDEMLKYYHNAGIINRCGGIIVLDMSWLTHLLNQLISFRPFGVQEGVWVEQLRNTGIIESEQLERLLEEELTTGEGHKPTKEMIAEVLRLIETFRLIVPFKPDGKDKVYLVPSVVTKDCDDITALTLQAEKVGPAPLYVKFCGGIMMSGVFPSLVVRLTPWLSAVGTINPLMLYDSHVKLSVKSESEKDHFLLHIYGCRRFIKVILVNASGWKSDEEKKRRRLITGSIRNFLETILELLRAELQWLKNMDYTFCVANLDSTQKCSAHGKERCRDDECIPLLQIGKGVGAREFAGGDWSQEDEGKQGIPAPVDLMRIAIKAEKEWRALGELLGFSRSQLESFRKQGESDRTSLFLLLMSWRDRSRTYRQLGVALMDSTVQRGDLTFEYCTREETLHESYQVGPEGKRLDYHGVTVDVPEGAFDRQITLNMSVRKTGPSLEKEQCVSPIIRFECSPKRSIFGKPIRVFLPFVGSPKDVASQSKMKLMCNRQGIWRDAKEKFWKEKSGLSFETNEFSNFVAVDSSLEIAELACFLFGQANASKESLDMQVVACDNNEIERLSWYDRYAGFPIRELDKCQILHVESSDTVKVSTNFVKATWSQGQVKVEPEEWDFKVATSGRSKCARKLFGVSGDLEKVSPNAHLQFVMHSAERSDEVTLEVDLFSASLIIRTEELGKKIRLLELENARLTKEKQEMERRLEEKDKEIENVREQQEESKKCALEKDKEIEDLRRQLDNSQKAPAACGGHNQPDGAEGNFQLLPDDQSEKGKKQTKTPLFSSRPTAVAEQSLFYLKTTKGNSCSKMTACAVKARLKEDDKLNSYYFLTRRPDSPLVKAHIAKQCNGKKSVEVQKAWDFSPNLRFLQPVKGVSLTHFLNLKSPSSTAARNLEAYAYYDNKLITLKFKFDDSKYKHKLGKDKISEYAVGAPIVQKEGDELFVVGVLGMSPDGEWKPELFVNLPAGNAASVSNGECGTR